MEEKCMEEKYMEKKYMEVVKKDPKAASKLLNEFNLKVMNDAEALTEDLTNQVFTIRTTDIQAANFFANNKRKD